MGIFSGTREQIPCNIQLSGDEPWVGVGFQVTVQHLYVRPKPNGRQVLCGKFGLILTASARPGYDYSLIAGKSDHDPGI
ncbi:MAG: hypothetical protein DBP02_09390 [gamma proteobacterium symbiont of Ctena orbiculata]|nr:MAG: hypothetical protein DBP02_09390 [gamma proteobacterium symbiont of Ctena orbiculata]